MTGDEQKEGIRAQNAYILSQDKSFAEKRLDLQHHFVNTFGPKDILHPAIPKNKIKVIADVGTCTGIWLEDVALILGAMLLNGNKARKYHGFDASDGLFPRKHELHFKFVVHNMLDPFPKQLCSQYDLVHVRFVKTGLKQEEVGYIQWHEYDFSAIENWGSYAEMQAIHEEIKLFRESQSYVDDITGLLRFLFENIGLRGVCKKEVLFPKMFARTENRPEEEAAMVKDKLAAIEKWQKTGGLQGVTVVMVLGRKSKCNGKATAA
ncbi:hypothetical protein B0J14DRAFT_662750 [Halenospora varia]|nr:hypothetical protein B0J14DRAFT_662750 [Halenospora varia]